MPRLPGRRDIFLSVAVFEELHQHVLVLAIAREELELLIAVLDQLADGEVARKDGFEIQAVAVGTFEPNAALALVDGFTEILNADNLKNSKIVQQGAYTLLMAMKNKGKE